MNKMRLISRELLFGVLAAVCWLAVSGCEYEVPITANPTRKVDARLIGDWTAKKDEKEKMKVRKLDDSTYIVSYDDNLCRAYHSDVGKAPLVSVQNIDSVQRKYFYFTWNLSPDGKQLTLRLVNDKVIPDDVKDSASVQKLLEKNLQNPNLFKEEALFTKEK